MPTVAILPVKSFRLSKARMAEGLSPAQRSELGRRLATRTADLTLAADLIPVLVAGDAEVADWALGQGLPIIPDPGSGLSAAAEAGTRWAEAASSRWIVIHTDLPLLAGSDLDELTRAIDQTGWVIAPSSDGGTTALGGSGIAAFAYGAGSFHRHLRRFPRASIVSRLGLLHDIDSLADLESARRHRRGKWLAELLA